MLLTIVPISYLLLKYFGIRPEYVFVVHIIVELFTQYARLRIVLPMIGMKLSNYTKYVIKPIFFIIVLSPWLPYITSSFIYNQWTSLFGVCFISVFSLLGLVYFIGCTTSERLFIKEKVFKIIMNITNKK